MRQLWENVKLAELFPSVSDVLILWRRRCCWRLDVATSQLAKARYFRPADLVGKKRGYVFALIMIINMAALLRDKWMGKDGTERGCVVLRFDAIIRELGLSGHHVSQSCTGTLPLPHCDETNVSIKQRSRDTCSCLVGVQHHNHCVERSNTGMHSAFKGIMIIKTPSCRPLSCSAKAGPGHT